MAVGSPSGGSEGEGAGLVLAQALAPTTSATAAATSPAKRCVLKVGTRIP